MQLTILIPSRNRASHLELLINSLTLYLGHAELEWEILVSNNHSSDTTGSVLAKMNLDDPRIKVVSPDRPLDTAEENLCFGIGASKGEYIWLLGDDDIPEEPGVRALVEIVKGSGYDFILFNSRGIDNSGEIFSVQKIPCIGKTWETTIDNFVVHQGFMYTLAGFSTCILRRKHFDPSVFEEYRNVSPIYSHVASFVDCYYRKPMLFVNIPLVRYRRNQYAEGQKGHWESVAEREKKFEKFFWTIGFIRQLKHLIDRGKLSYEHIYFSIEQSDNDRFRLIYYIVFMMYLQLRLEVGKNPVKFRISREELIEFREFLLKTIPEEWALINCFSRLIALPGIAAAKLEAREITARLYEILENINSKSLAEQFFLSRVDGKPLYYHAWKVFGFVSDKYDSETAWTDSKATDIIENIDYLESSRVIEHKGIIPDRLSHGKAPVQPGTPAILPQPVGAYKDRAASKETLRQLFGEPIIVKIVRKIWKKLLRSAKRLVKRIIR